MTEVPGYLQDLLELVVGQKWPDGDEGRLRQIATAWKQAASGLQLVRQDAGDGVTAVTEAAQGPAHDAFMAYWAKTFDNGAPAAEGAKGGGSMPALPWSVEFCQMMADACDTMALELETTKDMIVGQLVILFGEIAATTASSFLDFGASEAAVPEEVAVSRGICSKLLDSAVGRILEKILAGALEQALLQGGLDMAIQLKEIAEGNRKTVDWRETGQAAESGAINGAVGGALGGGLELAGGKAATLAASGIGKVAIGAAGGGLGAAATDLVTTGHVSLADVEKGAAGGALGGGLHLGGEHLTEGVKDLMGGGEGDAHAPTLDALDGTGSTDAALQGLQGPARQGSTLHSTLSDLDTFHSGDATVDLGPAGSTSGGTDAHLQSDVTSLAGLSGDVNGAGNVDALATVGGGAGDTLTVGSNTDTNTRDAGSTGASSFDPGTFGGGSIRTDVPFSGSADHGLFAGGAGRDSGVGDPVPGPRTGEPLPVEPAPRSPDPRPAESRPTEPALLEPRRTEPARTEPVSVDRAPLEPTRAEPRPTEPGPAEPVFSEAASAPPDRGAPERPSPSGPDESGHTHLASTDLPVDTRPPTDDPTHSGTGSDPAASKPGDGSPEGQPNQSAADPRTQPVEPGPYPDGAAQRGGSATSDPSRGGSGGGTPRSDPPPPAPAYRPDPATARTDRPAPADPRNQNGQNGQNGQSNQSPNNQNGDGGGGQNAQAAQPGQPVQPGPTQILITAAAVPGSGFRGHAEAPTTDHIDQLRGGVDAAVRSVVGAHGGLQIDSADAARGVYRITDTTGVYGDGRRSFTVRVETQRIGDDTAARSVLNHDKNEHVIQVSDQISVRHVQRAVAHEIGEIVADRQRYIVDKLDAFAPDEGNLRPDGPTAGVKLTPHDAGRVQELRVLGEQMDRLSAGARSLEEQAQLEDTHREAMALVEHLGLREGTPGATERRALIFDAGRLAPDAQAHVRSLLTDAGGPRESLSHDDQQILRNIHDQARADQATFDAHRDALEPAFARPIADGGGKIEPARMQELADTATAQRAEKSQETLAELRRQAVETAKIGGYPKVSFEAGGGAALSGRDPGALLVDDRGRWQSDNGDRIAQTADQLRNLRQTGLGDPYQFVGEGGPGARVPLEAVRYWEDSIAAQGPVIDGTATFRRENGKLLADISPSDGSPTLTVEVEGAPVIASGFPPEIIPGIDRSVGGMHGAFDNTAGALAAMGTPDAASAKAQIDALSWRDPASAQKALDILAAHAIDRGALPEPATRSLGQIANWQSLRDRFPGRVISGDEANLAGTDAGAAKEWIVAGTGGTGISGVENMLKLDPDAKFTMLGRNAPPGLGDNTQWKEVRGRHDLGFDPNDPSAPSRQNPDGSWPNPTATGRLTMAFDPSMNITGIEDRTGSGGPRFAVAGIEGDGVIASLGTRNSVPPAVADLVDAAVRRDPKSVSGRMLFDDDGQYLGYRITVDGRALDVTGAASRFFPVGQLFEARPGDAGPLPASGPGTVWSTDDTRYAASGRPAPGAPPSAGFAAQTGSNRDAPPEGGNFDGGYVATATQTAHYAAWRRQGTDPQPMPPGPVIPHPPAPKSAAPNPVAPNPATPHAMPSHATLPSTAP
ncbi:MAG TPA: hypothetical protein VFU73_04625 [Actinocrinis sp.]|nr:hypothetical protein [Actinocrinis sp.]